MTLAGVSRLLDASNGRCKRVRIRTLQLLRTTLCIAAAAVGGVAGLQDIGAQALKSDDGSVLSSSSSSSAKDHRGSMMRDSPRPVKLPYTPCGGSCTSDGFAAGGTPGKWAGVVCPAKCAECQSDGVIAPKPYNTSGSLGTNHYCESSPNSFYQHRTYSTNEQFRVRVDGIGRDTTHMRDYTGRLEYVAFSLNYSRTVPAAGPSTLLPSSDSSQFPSTCSSLPLVFGCSNVAC